MVATASVRPRLERAASVVALALALPLAGCRPAADAGSTALVATDVAAVAPAFAALANELAVTCLETREYASVIGLGARASSEPFETPPLFPAFPARADAPSVGHGPTAPAPLSGTTAPVPGTTAATSDATAPRDSDCVEAEMLSRRAALENAAVLAYVAAVAELAGAGVRPDPALFASLGGAARSTGVVGSDATASGAARLADELGALLLGRRRDRDLAAVVGEANANGEFAAIVRSLRSGFADGSYDELRDERSVVDAYYADAIVREAAALPPTERVATTPGAIAAAARAAELRDEILEQRGRWRALDASLARRASALAPYVAILADLARIDAALAAARPIDAGAVARAAAPYAADLGVQAAALARAVPAAP